MKSAKLNLLQNFFDLDLQKARSLFGRKGKRLILTNLAIAQARFAADPNSRDAVPFNRDLSFSPYFVCHFYLIRFICFVLKSVVKLSDEHSFNPLKAKSP
jgi:hypothetical protein